MTVLVGVVDEKQSVMATDSALTRGWTRLDDAMPGKFARRSLGYHVKTELLFASTGFLRQHNLLEFAEFNVESDLRDCASAHKWLVTGVMPALRTAYAAAGFLAKKDDVVDSRGNLLIGVSNQIFSVGSDFSVDKTEHYDADGSGYEPALGSLFTTQPLKWTPTRRAKAAVAAASHHSYGVGGPIHVEKVPQ